VWLNSWKITNGLLPDGSAQIKIKRGNRNMITTKGTQGKKNCVVTRPFYYEGKVLKKGTQIELPAAFALEMKAATKVVFKGEESDKGIDPVEEAGKADKKK
jgi:hypothetical protein